MTALMEQLLKSPRLRHYFDEIAERLRAEEAARQRFREQMNDDTRAEFINGEVVMHSPSKRHHNRTAERAHLLLKTYVEGRDLGEVGHEKYLVELTRNDVEPDVVFWSRAKSAAFRADQLLFPPPDLVVEVLSESTAHIDRGTKFEDYAAHGVTEYWTIDPDAESLEQYVLAGEQYELRIKSGDGTVRCAAIPGAKFPVRALFDDAENRSAVRRAMMV